MATESTADDRKTVAAVRSLGKGGFKVTVGGDSFLRQPFLSRFCSRRLAYPKPCEDVEGFVQFLLGHLQRRHYDVLLPLSDYVTIPVSMFKEQFRSRVAVAVPDYEALSTANDKLKALSAARQAGIGVPETHAPGDIQELREISRSIRYPCVLKPRSGAGSVGLKFIDTPEELIRSCEMLPSGQDMLYDYRPLIQEYVPGEVHDVCLLFNNGEPRAALTQKRLKMYHSTGGIGVLNETTDEPELRDRAMELLRSLHWHGPAAVECKIDSRDGSFKFMEVNSRFWGTLDMAIQAGVDFPLLTCRMAVEGDIEPVFDYRVGLRYKWTFPYGFLHTMESDRKLESLWEFLRYHPGTRSDIWLSDPGPLLAAMVLDVGRLWDGMRSAISGGKGSSSGF